ncbi:hypothetical protein [Halomicrobium salinisoli]|uniref:hypothetical protein n=1 Tax=Halomicrobium salinisoli TaxID=2878391 RepID=UPI001CF03C3B|nr:hypothetical protein [Halomicrobium salinisoli]
MNWSRFRRDAVRTTVGKQWHVSALGIGVAVLYTLAMMVAGTAFDLPEAVTYAGGAVAGFVAGVALGTNPVDAFAYGVRAGGIGMTLVSVAVGVGSFALWFDASGRAFLLVSSLIGMLGIVMLVPVYALAGGFFAAIGTVLRRLVLPSEYNPPAR